MKNSSQALSPARTWAGALAPGVASSDVTILAPTTSFSIAAWIIPLSRNSSSSTSSITKCSTSSTPLAALDVRSFPTPANSAPKKNSSQNSIAPAVFSTASPGSFSCCGPKCRVFVTISSSRPRPPVASQFSSESSLCLPRVDKVPDTACTISTHPASFLFSPVPRPNKGRELHIPASPQSHPEIDRSPRRCCQSSCNTFQLPNLFRRAADPISADPQHSSSPNPSACSLSALAAHQIGSPAPAMKLSRQEKAMPASRIELFYFSSSRFIVFGFTQYAVGCIYQSVFFRVCCRIQPKGFISCPQTQPRVNSPPQSLRALPPPYSPSLYFSLRQSIPSRLLLPRRPRCAASPCPATSRSAPPLQPAFSPTRNTRPFSPRNSVNSSPKTK